MKTLLQALALIIFCIPLHAQMYGANDVGISMQKIKIQQDVNDVARAIDFKQETIRLIRPSIGIKFGYEFAPFVIEVAGKLNLEMAGSIGMFTGAKLYLNKGSELSFTPLIGAELNHLSFAAAGRVQWKHYCMELTKTRNVSYCSLGFKAYLYE